MSPLKFSCVVQHSASCGKTPSLCRHVPVLNASHSGIRLSKATALQSLPLTAKSAVSNLNFSVMLTRSLALGDAARPPVTPQQASYGAGDSLHIARACAVPQFGQASCSLIVSTHQCYTTHPLLNLKNAVIRNRTSRWDRAQLLWWQFF